MLLPEVFRQIPPARMKKHLLVVAQAMEKVEHGIVASLFLIVAGREENAVSDRVAQNLAPQGKALGATRGMRGTREGETRKNQCRHPGALESIHTAGPRRG